VYIEHSGIGRRIENSITDKNKNKIKIKRSHAKQGK